MEVDEVIGSTSSGSGDHAPQLPALVDLTLDLSARCSALLASLGVDPLTSSRHLPIGIPTVVVDYALSRAVKSTSELLDALSLLVAIDGVSDQVVRTFDPLLLDLCARWLEAGHQSEEQAEQRFCVLASLASLRPDLWRSVR